MDGISLLVGVAIGGVLGSAAAALVFLLRARGTAQTLATAQLTQQDLETQRVEVKRLSDALRTSETDAATAKASLEGARERVTDLEKEVREERRKADQFSEQLAAANTALGEEKTRGKEREESNRQVLAEREKSITELKASIEQSKVALTETFKATGADVLKLTAESLLKQAKDQFEGQHKLSQQDLEARQKAIDTALVPLREQLEKNEKLTKDLGEKREGDVKMLGEQLKQIADLQQKASAAAQTLSGALRDNRQRGRWGEVSLDRKSVV
jgi:DNA recombination protein RmuC